MSNKLLLLGAISATALATAHAAPVQKPAKPKTPAAPLATKPEAVLQTIKVDGATIRLRRARWAAADEVVSKMGSTGAKQLTLWFDALPDAKTVFPEGATATDYIVNVQVLDNSNRPLQVLPVNTLKLWHRPSLPYVPAKDDFKAGGQSVWRVQPFNPNFATAKIKIEWLKPGHPFERKTLPPSRLKFGKEADTPEAQQWLQVLEIELPQDQIEYGATDKTLDEPVAHSENADFKAELLSWFKSGSTSTATDGTQTKRTYFDLQLLLETRDPRDGAKLQDSQVFLSNVNGLKIPLTRRIQDASEWFTPGGKPLKANQKTLLGNFTMPPETDLDTPWTITVQTRGGTLEMNRVATPSNRIIRKK